MRVTELWRHPVKSMLGERLDVASVTVGGLEGDRVWGVVDEVTGKVLTGRREPRLLEAAARLGERGLPVVTLPDGAEVAAGRAGCDEALTAFLGHPVRLVEAATSPTVQAEAFVDATDDSSDVATWDLPPGRFVDAFPLLVVTTASLRAGAAAHPSGAWDTRRFRPNLVVDADGSEWLEDAWEGRTLEVGDAVLTGVMRAVRCTMVTRPQPGLERDLEIFKSIARDHGSTFGLWAAVATSGTVRVGDELRVV